MYRLLEFLKSVYVLLLFLVLECGAILLYANSDSYVNARFVGAMAYVSNSINSSIGNVRSYFALDQMNEELVERVAKLESELSIYRDFHIDSLLTAMSDDISLGGFGQTRIAARVVTNTINRRHNYIVIDRGVNSGVRDRMALITPEAEMVGEVVKSYDNYAVVMSVLNTKFKSSGRLVNSNHVGSISWQGEDRYSMRMSYLSKYAEPFEGAEVLTTNISTIFPEGITIGRVKRVDYNEDQTAYQLDIELAADISALDRVIVVGRNRDSEVKYINDMIEMKGSN